MRSRRGSQRPSPAVTARRARLSPCGHRSARRRRPAKATAKRPIAGTSGPPLTPRAARLPLKEYDREHDPGEQQEDVEEPFGHDDRGRVAGADAGAVELVDPNGLAPGRRRRDGGREHVREHDRDARAEGDAVSQPGREHADPAGPAEESGAVGEEGDHEPARIEVRERGEGRLVHGQGEHDREDEGREEDRDEKPAAPPHPTPRRAIGRRRSPRSRPGRRRRASRRRRS